MSTKLSIKSSSYLDPKKTVTDTINYVNPNIGDATALELAQKINALTLNTYQRTERIETTEIDTPKPSPVSNWRLVFPLDGSYTRYDNSPTWELTIPISKLGTNKTLQLRLSTPGFEQATQILDVQSTNETNWGLLQTSWAGDKNTQTWQQGLWYSQLNCDLVAPCDLTFNIKVAQTTNYAEINLPVIFHITEE